MSQTSLVIFAAENGSDMVKQLLWESCATSNRRREPHTRRNLPLMVWGVDARGERFLQEARAHDISIFGAALSSLDADIKSGDVIGVLFGRKKAHYLVVWISNDSAGDKMLVAVHRLEFDECPWVNLLTETDQPQTRQNSDSIHT